MLLLFVITAALLPILPGHSPLENEKPEGPSYFQRILDELSVLYVQIDNWLYKNQCRGYSLHGRRVKLRSPRKPPASE
jgi:hypothetical protein